MNFANKLTISRIIMALIIIILLIFPFHEIGIVLPTDVISNRIVIEYKYIFAGILFIIASITDFFDGFVARNKNMVTSLGKVLDAIADKVLTNSVLIILAVNGFISPIIAIVIVVRDIVVDSMKMAMGEKRGAVGAIKIAKVKTACLMLGIILCLFYNLPFELMKLRIADFLLIVATILSVISAIQYYNMCKVTLKES